jgi:hypothetical protein
VGAYLSTRELYLPAGTAFDIDQVQATAAALCDNATAEDLQHLTAEQWIHDDVDAVEFLTGTRRERQLAALRHLAHVSLRGLLTGIGRSLRSRDVARYRFDNGDTPGIDAYLTAGISNGDDPTDSFEAWTVLFEDHRFPHGWTDQIGRAAGLLHPHGTGEGLSP